MSTTLSEFWGWCADCARWFYCGHGTEGAAAATDCPVCLCPPVELQPKREIEPEAQRAGRRRP